MATMDDTSPTLASCNGSVCSVFHCPEGWRCENETLQRAFIVIRQVPETFRIINGYIIPIVILVTVVLNSLVCLILMKPNMRSPTNMILVLMAVCDTLTGLFPVPAFMYYYTGARYENPIYFGLCQTVDLTTRALPTIFHTASIWITLLLAVQRYVYVCHSFKARQWCTIANVIKASVVIVLLSIVVHFPQLIDGVYSPLNVRFPPRSSNVIEGCTKGYPEFLSNEDVQAYVFTSYFIFRVVFINIIPCVALVILNALLLRTMHQAKKRRKQLLQQNKKSDCRKLQESNSTTLMMAAVVGVFLVVEFPSGIIFTIFMITQLSTTVARAVDPLLLDILGQIFNYGIIISYPVNFFIYCRMSRQFRETFRALFKKGPVPLDREHSQYTTLPNENGRSAPPAPTNETAI